MASGNTEIATTQPEPPEHLTADKLDIREALTATLVYFATLIPLFATPLLPFVDHYEHLARFYILAHINEYPELSAHYTSAWALLPNLGLDLIGTGLMKLLPPLVVAHVLIGGLFLLIYLGILFIHHTLFRAVPLWLCCLAGCLCYSFILHWGFTNYLMAFGLTLWGLGAWIRLSGSPVMQALVGCVFALLIFFSHGFAFGVYGILLGAMELSRWLFATPGKLISKLLNIPALARLMAPIAAQAVIPVLLFLSMPTSGENVTKSGENLGRHVASGGLTERLIMEIEHRLYVAMRVIESPYLWLDFASIAIILITGLALAFRNALKPYTGWWGAAAATAILFLLLPPNAFGAAFLPDRLPLTMAAITFAMLSIPDRDAFAKRAATIVFGTVFIVRIAATTFGWYEYRQPYTEYLDAIKVIEPGGLIGDVRVSDHRWRDLPSPRCHSLAPLAISLRHAATPIFASPNQQPLRQKQPLLDLAKVDAGTPDFRFNDVGTYYDDVLTDYANGAGDADYVVLCGKDRLTRPVPDSLIPLKETAYFSIYKVQKPDTPATSE